MKRRSGAGGEPIKGRRRKAPKPKRRNAPKAVTRSNSTTSGKETEVARLSRELNEALERQAATSEVLQVISSFPGDPQPVFAATLENAVRICDATFGNIYRWDGEAMRLVASENVPPTYAEVRERLPLNPSPQDPVGRMIITKTVVHTVDLATEPAYTAERIPSAVAAVELGGVRTFLAVPIVKENELVGAFMVSRQEVRPFTDKQIELVKNFAAQAASP
ncbi:MAG TPA: GAF domain-containing protein [Xanthobacteraceae bacterium]|nr:GAF domain-containing protein [Xanthobacteraceae bacterium]